MDLIVKQGASPALYQPRFVVVCGGGQLRVVTYAFAGDPIGGDRPVSCHGLQRQPLLRIPTAAVSWTNMDPPLTKDTKFTSFVLRLVTGNLFSDESTSEPGTLPMRYSISHTECRAIADVIAKVRHRLTRGLATAFTCVLTAFRGGAGASTA